MNDSQVMDMQMTPKEAPHASEPVPHPERVSVLYGDRLCTRCNYNLIGQPVLREPHYQLLIVRCPECATVASLQDYPQMGRWAGRWSVILNGLWLLVILAVTFAGFGAMVGPSAAFTEEVTDIYDNELRANWNDWYVATFDTAPTSSWWRPDKFDEWLAANPADQILANTGGLWAAIWHPELLFFLIPLSVAFVYGCFVSVGLIHLKRKMLMTLSVAVLGLGVMVMASVWWGVQEYPPNQFGDLSFVQVGLPLLAIVFTGCWMMITCGALAGRSIARMLVRIMLPPRLRLSVSVLWTTDGLEAPCREMIRT